MKILAFALLVASTQAIAAGCGGGSFDVAQCETVCAAQIKGGCNSGNCTTNCSENNAFGSASGCESEVSAEYSCLAGLSDPCTDQTGQCTQATTNLLQCIQPYCNANPSSPGCS